ncbi:MAG: nucleotidyl transferase AbiEii/AbiGii toxin family protein [Chitinophagales bacterium]|nr:nucleotidyl transferase AbiEii/AbiGii toxin family protein [Chitinophagales bacterium]
MLQTQTVSSELMELLEWLMQKEDFSKFALVGGTSLALQIGHRNSIDIDLFGNLEIQHNLFLDILSEFGSPSLLKHSKNIFITSINNIKVDFVNYKYPLLDNIVIQNGIRMYSKRDIAAMKINAISGRGSKKDFIDLYFLLQEFSLFDMMNFYKQKYQDGSEFLAIKSLAYFSDADLEVEPKMFKPFDWGNCKEFILSETRKL